MKKNPELLDTTLRDGEQMENVAFAPDEKLKIAEELLKIGVNRIEVASARSVNEDKSAVKNICKMAEKMRKLNSVEVLGFVDYNKSVDWISELGCRTINLLAKGSEKHCKSQLKKTPNEHLNDIIQTVDYAKSKRLNVNVYLEDWSNGMIHSKNYVLDLINGLQKKEIKRFMLPDTLGVLDPWKTEKFIKEMVDTFPYLHFDFHAHNDYDLGTANTLAALRSKATGVHATLNALGERAGNCSLYSIVAGAKDHLGVDFGVDESKFYELSKLVEQASKIKLQPNTSVVGSNAHQQTAGVHADGDEKDELYRNKLSAERFGKERIAYSLGKHAGVSSVSMNLKQMGIVADRSTVKKLTEQVRKMGALKKTVAQEDLYLLIRSNKS